MDTATRGGRVGYCWGCGKHGEVEPASALCQECLDCWYEEGEDAPRRRSLCRRLSGTEPGP
jgi:hypothetical protein